MNQETEFLQSEDWLRFQEAAGKKVIRFSDNGFSANGVIHTLPFIGQYLYVPRGPLIEAKTPSVAQALAGGQESRIKNGMRMLLKKAEENKAGWVRIEPETDALLADIVQVTERKIVKAPHDMQPRETLVVDLSPSEETLFAAMKPKTRYNIRLAEKRGVKVFTTREEKYRQTFLDLIQATADRKEIVPHSRAYYEKFFTALSEGTCWLFIAEYNGQVIAANLLIIFGTTATYLHGGSASQYRDVMAPYLLQWEQMRFAKVRGCVRYDFGGVRTEAATGQPHGQSSWAGITRFKRGFAPETQPHLFPGTYDIILAPKKYTLYNRLRLVKDSVTLMRRFLRI